MRRDNLKILRILRGKNIPEYNLIYDNISEINENVIKNSSLKDAHKKILLWYKKYLDEEEVTVNNILEKITDEQKVDLQNKISYGEINQLYGDVYRVDSDDSYCSKILVPYASYLFNYGNTWLYKHINIGNPPRYINKIDDNVTYSDYKKYVDGEIKIDNSPSNYNTPSNNVLSQYGVRFIS